MVYIPKKQIMTRFKRYRELNETRLAHALSLMSHDARFCLSIVPVLLHYNHVNLPGYRSGGVPHGIDMFTPDERQRRFLQDTLVTGAPPLKEPREHAILGLYAMGSTSSIGQSDSSDVDIWVCVKASLSREQTAALQDKCRFITKYIKSQGVELNLFVTPEDRFTNFQPDCLDEENCGSAQNLFLLDEFYRSSIRLCGRYIVWYLISTKEEQQAYDEYVTFLTQGVSGMEQFIAKAPASSHILVNNRAGHTRVITCRDLSENTRHFSAASAPLLSVCPLLANSSLYVSAMNEHEGTVVRSSLLSSLESGTILNLHSGRSIDTQSQLVNFCGSMELAYPLSSQLVYASPVVTDCHVSSALGSVPGVLHRCSDAAQAVSISVRTDSGVAAPGDAGAASAGAAGAAAISGACASGPADDGLDDDWAPSLEQVYELNKVELPDTQVAIDLDNDDLIDDEYFRQNGIPHYAGFLSLEDWIAQLRDGSMLPSFIRSDALMSRSSVYAPVIYTDQQSDAQADAKARSVAAAQSGDSSFVRDITDEALRQLTNLRELSSRSNQIIKNRIVSTLFRFGHAHKEAVTSASGHSAEGLASLGADAASGQFVAGASISDGAGRGSFIRRAIRGRKAAIGPAAPGAAAATAAAADTGNSLTLQAAAAMDAAAAAGALLSDKSAAAMSTMHGAAHGAGRSYVPAASLSAAALYDDAAGAASSEYLELNPAARALLASMDNMITFESMGEGADKDSKTAVQSSLSGRAVSDASTSAPLQRSMAAGMSAVSEGMSAPSASSSVFNSPALHMVSGSRSELLTAGSAELAHGITDERYIVTVNNSQGQPGLSSVMSSGMRSGMYSGTQADMNVLPDASMAADADRNRQELAFGGQQQPKPLQYSLFKSQSWSRPAPDSGAQSPSGNDGLAATGGAGVGTGSGAGVGAGAGAGSVHDDDPSLLAALMQAEHELSRDELLASTEAADSSSSIIRRARAHDRAAARLEKLRQMRSAAAASAHAAASDHAPRHSPVTAAEQAAAEQVSTLSAVQANSGAVNESNSGEAHGGATASALGGRLRHAALFAWASGKYRKAGSKSAIADHTDHAQSQGQPSFEISAEITLGTGAHSLDLTIERKETAVAAGSAADAADGLYDSTLITAGSQRAWYHDEQSHDAAVAAAAGAVSAAAAGVGADAGAGAAAAGEVHAAGKSRGRRRSRTARRASVKMVRVARSLARNTSFTLKLQKFFPTQGERGAQRVSSTLSSPYAQDLMTGSVVGFSGNVSLTLDASRAARESRSNADGRHEKAAGIERLAAAMGIAPVPFLNNTLPVEHLLTESQSIEDLDHYVDGKKKLASSSGNYPEWAYGSILSRQECEEEARRDNFHEFEAPLDASEWFDFGSVVKSSPTEYFGSGLWLLYKAIDSPFKVVLKILLMEAYSNDYPDTHLLSSELKDYMLSHDGYSLDLDSYYLMYLKVSNYLQSIGHESRLMLMRKCFYLKIFMGLNNKASYHREDFRLKRELLNKFSVRWGWSPEFVSELEQVATWKMEAVRSFDKEVYRTLLESYQSLLRFSVRHGIEYAITSDDAGILSRKLYAAFDRFPGKVMVINSSFSHNLEERDLTFICPSPHSLCRRGWHLYSTAGDDVALLNLKVSYIGARLSEVVTWAVFNGLLTTRTSTWVKGAPSAVTPLKINKLSHDIKRYLQPRRGAVSEQSLQRSVKLHGCLVVLNLEKDDTELLQNKIVDIDYSSTLCCGRQRSCLIGSIDLITVNSWGELRTIALPNGEEGVVELLATLLRIMSNTTAVNSVKDMLELIEICSYAASYQDLIKYDLEGTVRQVFSCMTTDSSSEYVFDVGRNTYIARAQGERGVMINKKSVFGSSEYDISVLSRYGMRPEYALQVPPIVDRYATSGIVQYFFCPQTKGHWDIYIVNERNEVTTYRNYFGSRATLVNAINRFYTSQSEGGSNNAVRFNLPQYFVLNKDLNSIHPFTIRGSSS